MPGRREEILVGLDIGSSKVCATVAEITANDEVDIIGIGTSPSKGVRAGIIDNIAATTDTILCSIQEAELMAGCSIREVYVNISGEQLQGKYSSGVVALKEQEVNNRDLVRVIDAAQAIPLGQEYAVFQTLPQHFCVDGQPNISNPLGLSGIRLEAKVHLITAPYSALQNITKCVGECSLSTSAIICDAVASSEAILTDDEKDLGVMLVDIGAGTTDIAIWENGSIVYSVVLAIGGDDITRDISTSLRTSIAEAERIKIRFGTAKPSLVRRDENIRLSGVGGRSSKEISRLLLAEIIESRIEEIFSKIQQDIEKQNGGYNLTSGIVLTGGTTNLDGIVEMAEGFIGLPVRRGTPQHIGGLIDVVRSPAYATSIGLILHAIRRYKDPIYIATHIQKSILQRGLYGMRNFFSKTRRWFDDFF